MWWLQSNKNDSLSAFLNERDLEFIPLLTSLLEIVDEAAALARGFYEKVDELEVVRKGDATPLTDADTALHLLLCKRLDALLPVIPILSEESEGADIADRLSWPACWVVDPLDGTKEFIEKTDQFTINIALVLDGVSELGLISIPCRKEHWLGVVQNGAAVFPEGEGLNGSVVNVQGLTRSKPLVMLASHRHSPKCVQALLDCLSSHFGEVERRNSGSAVKFCEVAAGNADVYPRTSACGEWDVAAGDALVRAAGGCVTKFDGEPIKYNQRSSLLAESFIAGGDACVDYAAIFNAPGFSDRG
jgi:3'(2'), 5'-bisphosphate nucleotidase